MKILRKIVSDELPFLFSCPALLWQALFLYLPLIMLLCYSFVQYDVVSASYALTLHHYKTIFNSLYFKVIVHSFFTAVVTAIICLLVAYPVAYFLAMKVRKRYRTLFLFLVILPSWTSLIVQIYAWFFLLERNGIFCRLLYSLGILPRSVHLLNNYFSILVGLVSCFLPFMIMPIYAVLERININIIEASADLGANRFETFRRIILPLSTPGVYAGFLLVFIPAFGEFAIPILLGGSKQVFWGNLIVDKFLRSQDWASGAALANIGIMFPVIILLFVYLTSRVLAILKSNKQRHEVKEPW